MRIIENLAQLTALIGNEVAVSDWLGVEQDRIQQFADATDDQQWIHTDPARAQRESPFRTAIAHGYLTLSLLPHFMTQALRFNGVRMTVNYGLNRLRFPAPVPVGSRLRARFTLSAVEPVEGGQQATWLVTIEREGGDKPVCVAEALMRYYS
ncbi:MAG: MaoC family dehydratase [Nevskia sp.]|jgi:acyl dehydratase|nr:MaoC family dehydratase [Nevskia sp.]MCK9385765.1 MaoC family dehydratase [Nevskia sp.]